MLNKAASILARELIELKIIDEDSIEIYEYGAKSLLEQFFCFVCIMILFILDNDFMNDSVFLIVLIILRTFTGGYHMQSFKGCFVLSVMVSAISIMIIDLFTVSEEVGLLIIIMLMILIFQAGPIENQDFPLCANERKYLKKGISIGNVIIFFFTYLFSHFHILNCYNAVVVALIVVRLSMIPPRNKNKSLNA